MNNFIFSFLEKKIFISEKKFISFIKNSYFNLRYTNKLRQKKVIYNRLLIV